jgi:hypothetical protein
MGFTNDKTPTRPPVAPDRGALRRRRIARRTGRSRGENGDDEVTDEQLSEIEARAKGNGKPSDSIQFVIHEQSDVLKLVAEVRRLRAALTEIASYKEGLIVTSSFDEPSAAKVARAALEVK